MEIIESNINEEPVFRYTVDINDSEDIRKEKEEAWRKLSAFLQEGRKSFEEGRIVSSEQLKREFPFISELSI